MDDVPVRIELMVLDALVGSRFAVAYADDPRIYISPAMRDLLRGAAPEEVEFLLANIPVENRPSRAACPE